MQNKKNYYLGIILLCNLTRYAGGVTTDPFDAMGPGPFYGSVCASVVNSEQELIVPSWFRIVLQEYYGSLLYYYCFMSSWVKRACGRTSVPALDHRATRS